jgi:dihydrofolate reductase
MAHVVFGMNASVDGFVSDPSGSLETMPVPGDELHQHFNDHVRSAALCLYGRRLYEVMQFWDTPEAEDNPIAADYADAWRATPKVVVSTTLSEVGSNASLLSSDIEAGLRRLVEETEGTIDVGGPTIAATLTRLGLVDEYRVYVRPVAIGAGNPLLALDGRMDLELLGTETFPDGTVQLRYAPVR